MMIERLGVSLSRVTVPLSRPMSSCRRLSSLDVPFHVFGVHNPLLQHSLLLHSPILYASCHRHYQLLRRQRHSIAVSSLKGSGRSSYRKEAPFSGYGYHRVALIGSATLTLCRLRESRRGSDHPSADLSSSVDSDHSHAVEGYPDPSEGVSIPIDFGPSRNSAHAGRPSFPYTGGHILGSLWDHFKGSLWLDRLFGSPFRCGLNDGALLGLIPILGKASPSDFGNAFLLSCCGIFGLWHASERLNNPWLSQFMERHFVASRSAIDLRRYHTLLTCAISHSSFMHLLFNCAMFYQLIGTFQRHMSCTVGPRMASSFDRFLGGLYDSVENLVWGERRPLRQRQHVQTGDIVNVMLLSAIGSSLGHVLLYRTPVIGASGAISGLLYLLASTFPNSYFRTVFPIPGLEVSILQVGQMFVLTNLYFIYYGSGWRNVAWGAHLFGMAASGLYCYAQQHLFKRPGFHNPVMMSFRTAKRQWLRTLKGIGGYH